MRVALVGGARFGIVEPLAGGMESLMMSLAEELTASGADVTVFAGLGAETATTRSGVTCVPLMQEPFVPSLDARADVSMPPDRFIAEHHAYLMLNAMLRDADFDVVHNHSLHYLPPLFDLDCPMVHTLHSPPTPWLESAHSCCARRDDIVVSVSQSNAARWGRIVDRVILNGVDVDRWGRGCSAVRSDAVAWMGRLVPEKAPHLAIDAARIAGRPIDLAGPRHDHRYFDEMIRPRIGEGVRYVGHLKVDALANLVGRAAVAAVTPAWDEPYGLVVAEALAAGTPVAAFARGGILEILDATCGVLATPDDPTALADAIEQASHLSSEACRRRARQVCSMGVMADHYLATYQDAVAALGLERDRR